MFSQLLTPVADSLALSFLVAVLPVVVVLILLGLLRMPAWIAALAGLIVALIVAIAIWQMPVNLALNSVANGAVRVTVCCVGIRVECAPALGSSQSYPRR